MAKKNEYTFNLLSSLHTLHGFPHGEVTVKIVQGQSHPVYFEAHVFVRNECGQEIMHSKIEIPVRDLLAAEEKRRR